MGLRRPASGGSGTVPYVGVAQAASRGRSELAQGCNCWALLAPKRCHQCSSPIKKAIDERSGCNPSLGRRAAQQGRRLPNLALAGFAAMLRRVLSLKFSLPSIHLPRLKESKGPGRFRSCPGAQVGQEDTQHYSHKSSEGKLGGGKLSSVSAAAGPVRRLCKGEAAPIVARLPPLLLLQSVLLCHNPQG